MAANPKTAHMIDTGQKEDAAGDWSREATPRSISVPQVVSQVGFWSAILSGIFAFGWFAGMVVQTILSPPEPWTGIDAFARSFRFIQMLNFIPSLPLASAFLVLMVCVYFYASEEKKIWGLLGLAFTIVYSVMASINYLIQLLVVRQSLALGETEGLGLFAHGNTHSVFWALASSYAYMSLAMLFAAWVFGSNGLERWVHWLFIIVGVTAPFQFVGVIFELGLLVGAPAGLIWSIATPLACFLLAVLFKRAERK
ncbi:MAG TPA: hypothetical protein VJ793_08655 [Anaerolineae bacterium]|nr:hypothetical protein [Anaerolineae bacterium]